MTTPGVTAFETPNWVRSIQDIVNKREAKRLLANASLQYEPLKGLVLKTSLNGDIGSNYQHNFQPSTPDGHLQLHQVPLQLIFTKRITDIGLGCPKPLLIIQKK